MSIAKSAQSALPAPRPSATQLLRAGQEHHRAGRIEQAEAMYRQAIELDASSVDAQLNLGMALHELGRSAEATEILGKLVVDHPECAAGWVQLARVIAPQGFAWEAHGAITRALKGKPDAQTLASISMLQLTLLQDAKAAEKTIRRALKLAPLSTTAWMQLGQILAAKGRKSDAAAAYQQALAIDPHNSLAAFLLAAMEPSAAPPASTAPATADDLASNIPATRPPAMPAMAPPEYVRALFDGCAERFDALLVGSLKYRTPQMLERLFSRWLQEVGADPSKPMVMLDAGCGTGLCGQWLARHRGRLIGVDLSRRMLAEAKACQVYDELVPGEVVEELEKRPASLDLIVAADVLVYFGDLARLFAAAAAALRPAGVFLFSVEAAAEGDYRLLPTQRFAHSMAYLHRLAAKNGLTIRVSDSAVLRQEKGEEVHGRLVLAWRHDGGGNLSPAQA